MLRVPGSERKDLRSLKAQGGDVRIIYSPWDAVKIARQNPDRQVVFFAVGFETTSRQWRGIGMIEESGLKLRDRYSKFDAEKRFNLKDHQTQESSDCISGLILQGIKKPTQCAAFGKKCTPENPLGAPMVSSEGACAAYYRYRQLVVS